MKEEALAFKMVYNMCIHVLSDYDYMKIFLGNSEIYAAAVLLCVLGFM
jgi:hypothetical protein